MNYKNINSNIFNATFKDYAEAVMVVISSTKTPGANFDPRRNSGYIKTKNNPICIKALVETISSNSLISKSLGLSETGAIRLTITNCDVGLIKIAEKITINGVDYTQWNEALGNRFQLFPIKFGFTKVILFRDTKNG